MLRLTEIKLPLDHAPSALEAAVIAYLGIEPSELRSLTVFKRGWDARKKSAIQLVCAVDIEVANEGQLLERRRGDQRLRPTPDMSYKLVAHAPAAIRKRPVVIGAGPCGLFAGLILAEMGFRPIILERGTVVRARTKDTWGLWRRSVLNPESNVQFGEGGAGTFSDGKLWSGIKDPHHLGRKVLTEFVEAGAPAEILVSAKPHIGTFRLVTMVESLRAKIEALGGEYHFQSRVTDIQISTNGDGTRQVRGVTLADGREIETDHLVLAIGHSARDMFETLVAHGVYVEPKPLPGIPAPTPALGLLPPAPPAPTITVFET